ncbi:putative ammonium transporter 1 [Physella acuta]|uniref:putative ammonium transporter 1 n=1 Tax=Physella acuta TaxID=109671 RepID=UPI0027DDE442|nr:putative ammonium transporter 1 [Physella acuta]
MANVTAKTVSELTTKAFLDLTVIKHNSSLHGGEDDGLTPKHYTDQLYLLVFGIMIVFMDVGFGLIEAGSVRTKNTTHILIKNILDSLAAGIAYWLFGFALAFGYGNEFVGWTNWAMAGLDDSKIAFAFYQAMFASTATTIVAGAVTERCEFIAYLLYSFVLTGFIYPVVTHWGWAYQGWLFKGHNFNIDGKLVKVHYEDFGGSGVVHLVGGTAALVAAIIIGPRIGRFDKDTGKVNYIKGHSVALATIGVFVLLFGFMALNAGAQHHISYPGDASAISLAVFNTLIAASVGGFVSLFTHRIGLFGNSWSIHAVINGAFASMVAICGGCNSMRPWGAAIVGVVASFLMKGIEQLLFKLKIDDPLNAVGIHFGGGAWGIISVAFFKYDTGIVLAWNKQSGAMLAWQLAGVGAIVLWTGVLTFFLFGALRLLGIFRVSEEVERKGLDITRHHQNAYPLESYGYGHLHIMAVGDNGNPSSIEQGYVNKVFVTYEGHHDPSDKHANGIQSIHTVPSFIELEPIDDNDLQSLDKVRIRKLESIEGEANLSTKNKVKQLMPLLWKKGKNKGDGGKLGDVISAHTIDIEATKV